MLCTLGFSATRMGIFSIEKGMSHPTPTYPIVIWDGLTENIDRVDIHSNVNPDSKDWERAVAEIVAIQENPGGALISIVESIDPLSVRDSDRDDHPLTTAAIALVDATNGEIIVSMPPASQMIGKTLTVKKIDSSANAVVLEADGAETIDDLPFRILFSQYDSLAMVCDGTRWYII